MTKIMDGNWKLFAYDQETGRSIWTTWIDGKITFRFDTPVDQVIRSNAEQRNGDQPHRFGEYVHVNSVPLQLYHESGLSDALNQKDKKWLSRWQNDSDNAAWRVREGRF